MISEQIKTLAWKLGDEGCCAAKYFVTVIFIFKDKINNLWYKSHIQQGQWSSQSATLPPMLGQSSNFDQICFMKASLRNSCRSAKERIVISLL